MKRLALEAKDVIAGIVTAVAALDRAPKPETIRALFEGLLPLAGPAPANASPRTCACGGRDHLSHRSTKCPRHPENRARDARRAAPSPAAAPKAAKPSPRKAAGARAKRSPSPPAAPPPPDDSEPPRAALDDADRAAAWPPPEAALLQELISRRQRRKCNPAPRAVSYNRAALRSLVRRERGVTHLEVVTAQAQRPRTRGECKDGPRPCPWVSCRHHLALDVNPENGTVKDQFSSFDIVRDPDGEGLDRLEAEHGTCALDIADRHDTSDGVGGLLRLRQVAASGNPIGITDAMELQEVARAFGLSYEQIREIGSQAIQNVRIALRREDIVRVPKALVVLRDPEPEAEERTTPLRRCPACGRKAQIAGIACAEHWRELPRELRLRSWAAWPPGGELVVEAAQILLRGRAERRQRAREAAEGQPSGPSDEPPLAACAG